MKRLIAILVLALFLVSGCSTQIQEEVDYQISPNPIAKTYTTSHMPVQGFAIEHDNRNEILEFYKEAQKRKQARNKLLAESDAEEDANNLAEKRWQRRFTISTPLGNYHSVDEVESIFGTRRAAQDFSFLGLVYAMKYACYKFEDDDKQFESICYEYRAFEKSYPDFIDKEMYKEMKERLKREYELMGIEKYYEYQEKIGQHDINNFRSFVMFIQKYKIEDPKEYDKFRDEVRKVYQDFHSQHVTSDESKPSFY
ncbi:hypothetical protein HN419_07640 [Candidatus Woesearchaeota archaeon]|jgi:hypothetical protein|nr:hypothetical protein [Candidatus Woesearchaeota archaeon]MBT3538363.1 hypothetical protein [Candidatus Woesearchaeota archaeon]MBT4698340.1 hypothetical protein [Candidatus Woesearchaeota archaeon]MBT4717161.1 hypothetical protein [Candidatus Woesearchaeota archaeon]MBT7106032.1 hypothetical protein [Candidatus Woesearchaeota archaeon]